MAVNHGLWCLECETAKRITARAPQKEAEIADSSESVGLGVWEDIAPKLS